MAGLNPAGVICEIMNDDGTMARMPDLVKFAQRHGLKIATIADLIAYRRRTEKLVRRVAEGPFESHIGGNWRIIVYANTLDHSEHVVLTKGDIDDGEPVLVRMHAINVLDDLLADRKAGRAGVVRAAMREIDKVGRGVLVLLRDMKSTGLSELLKARQAEGATAGESLRDYGTGAQILLDLGVHDMILLSNTRKTVVGLDGYGLRIVGQHPLKVEEV